ncbi:Dihydrolipoyllysine-residue acetyltransferase component of pyruvate dehydrogenase complex [Botrimarina colliarenosi]|uniref:Dihydrolipoamide acetyltransferase component of pyruvate dehydrogenase complex n=1 Tax=Botrimarina colliarenosi TaxID=2528001 RepID=A0A5C6APH7_9BACT|nr:2-oxo acid dehydrogenase subunit E2 [Botrimarina colliarenosi]TWU00084.1 Dihydrolipoyllysine-residue acetyltransferase component of pyruvate dehydrogenase complex [Botrimarina colliarenosi]
MPQITLPSLGENIESGDILSILVAEGETVTADQDLLEIETDKATVPVPSPSAGKITKILVSEGDTVAVGAAIFEIEAGAAAPAAEPKPEPAAAPEPAPAEAESPEPESEPEPAPAPQAAAPAPEPNPVPQPAAKPAPAVAQDVPGDGHAAAAASPSVRRLARELGVDLRRVRPSGAGGRVTEDDVQAHVRQTQEQSRASAPASSAPGLASSDAQGAVRVEKMSRMRQTIAKNMVASYTTIPQLTNFDDVDVTDLEAMRQASKEDYASSGLKLTQMPFLIKAIAGALKLHPIVNASVDMEAGEVIYKEYVNIGVAVDTPKGLTVPVLRDADRMSISQITRQLDALVDKAREGKLSIDEMRGGTFTISNMGAVGGTYSTPIINPPEVAILLVGRSRMLPWVIGKGKEATIEPRLVMPLSLTYDHRVVDGADAARFVNELKNFLAAPGRLLLAP